MGAAFAALVSGVPDQLGQPPFKFAVLFSGFIPMNKKMIKSYFPSQMTTPSLHVIGLADNVVPVHRSRELAGVFKNSKVLEHEKDHIVPTDSHQVSVIAKYVLSEANTASL